MDLLKVLQDLVATIGALQTQLSDVPQALEAAKKASYDEGFVAGVASVPTAPTEPTLPVSDKIYSQVECDAKILEAVSAVQAELDAVKAELEVVKGSVDAKVSEAITAFKAEALEKVKAEEKDIEAILS